MRTASAIWFLRYFSFFIKEIGTWGSLTCISYHLKKIILVVKMITLDFLPFSLIVLLWKGAYERLEFQPFFDRIYNQHLSKHLKTGLTSLPHPSSRLISSSLYLISSEFWHQTMIWTNSFVCALLILTLGTSHRERQTLQACLFPNVKHSRVLQRWDHIISH